jgi:hypothetical protein
MNKTQKGAWYAVCCSLLFATLGIYMVIQIPIRHRAPEGLGRYIWLPVFLLISIIAIYLIRKKQSQVEVESDERDDIIKKKATVTAFVSVCFLLLASSVIPRFIVGPEGAVPVWLLPIINISVLYLGWFAYSLAVLIQYGRGGKGESHE